MKGLDGIQGPIYVGTGCVFRRQALYGFDAPKAEKEPTRTCNCWSKLCCCCCTSRKKNKKVKVKQEKKNKSRRSDVNLPVFNSEDIGVEGRFCILSGCFHCWLLKLYIL